MADPPPSVLGERVNPSRACRHRQDARDEFEDVCPGVQPYLGPIHRPSGPRRTADEQATGGGTRGGSEQSNGRSSWRNIPMEQEIRHTTAERPHMRLQCDLRGGANAPSPAQPSPEERSLRGAGKTGCRAAASTRVEVRRRWRGGAARTQAGPTGRLTRPCRASVRWEGATGVRGDGGPDRRDARGVSGSRRGGRGEEGASVAHCEPLAAEDARRSAAVPVELAQPGAGQQPQVGGNEWTKPK